MVIAYMRVSTEKQHLENQKEEILRFATKHKLVVGKWYSETVSGCVMKKKRKLSKVLESAQAGDILIVTEISRLSRTLLEVMNILNLCIIKNITLYSTKDGCVFQNNINSKVLAFAFGLVAEIERNLISLRTKEALALRKKEGKSLGRKPGNSRQLRSLRENKEVILQQLGNLSRAKIAESYGASRHTLYRFLKNETDL
jgi:DNA invertase Pin-like site-specific DNA recombinase